MKHTYGRGRIASVLALLATLLGGTGIANAQDLSTVQKPGDKGDYSVQVGKRVRWASEIYKERVEAARRASEAAGKIRTTSLMTVLVGKQTIPVATSEAARIAARRSETSVVVSSEQPERAKARGYFEKRGRATFWIELPK